MTEGDAWVSKSLTQPGKSCIVILYLSPPQLLEVAQVPALTHFSTSRNFERIDTQSFGMPARLSFVAPEPLARGRG